MESKIHFGVRASDGRTTNVWSCWTQPARGDAYLTSDTLGKALKLSDHQSGRTHIAYHYEKRDELFTPETLPNERFILRQDDGERFGKDWRLVACVYFPFGSPHDVAREELSSTIWLPEAPEGQATEVGVFRLDVATLADSWPGKDEGSSLVAKLPLVDQGRLVIAWRHAPFQMPSIPQITGIHNLFKERTEEDLLMANRAVLFGTTDTGALTLIETGVKVGRS